MPNYEEPKRIYQGYIVYHIPIIISKIFENTDYPQILEQFNAEFKKIYDSKQKDQFESDTKKDSFIVGGAKAKIIAKKWFNQPFDLESITCLAQDYKNLNII
ncbi:MAG: hypothetical protein ACOYT4_02715 [Nanoarchaeota archaeon]